MQVTRLQIYYGVTHAETTLFSFEELQSFDLPMTRFPFLLHHKGALIFQIKQPLFWKNGHIYPSLLGVLLLGLALVDVRDLLSHVELGLLNAVNALNSRDAHLVVCSTTELQKKSEFCIENAPLREVKLGEFDQEILRKVRKNGVSKKP